jgi:hypothetical protein
VLKFLSIPLKVNNPSIGRKPLTCYKWLANFNAQGTWHSPNTTPSMVHGKAFCTFLMSCAYVGKYILSFPRVACKYTRCVLPLNQLEIKLIIRTLR